MSLLSSRAALRFAACALAAVLLGMTAPAYAANVSTATVEAKKAEQAAILAQLQASRIDFNGRVSDYINLTHEIDKTRRDLSEATTRAAEAAENLRVAREALKTRAVQLYRTDRLDLIEILLSARSLRDLAVRANYLLLITERDSRMLTDVRLADSENSWIQQSLESTLIRLEELQTAADEQRAQIEQEMAVEQAEAASIGADLAALLRQPTVPSGGKPTGQFDPDMVISEVNFRAANSMTAADIQAFLEQQHGTLDTYRARDHNGVVRSPAEMIAEASVAFNVSPMVILATLQKEQSLLTDPSPRQSAYDWAMGAGKADTRTFYQYMGFGKQIWWGAEKLDKNARLWKPGATMKIDGSIVRPANPGTFGQYRYTPHLHGVMSFWLIYWRYFGDPVGTA